MSTKLFIFLFITFQLSPKVNSFLDSSQYNLKKDDLRQGNRDVLPKPVDKVVAQPTLGNTLYALEKVMFFFYKKYNKLNFDGLFGVRFVQAELRRILLKGEQNLYPQVHNSQEIKTHIRKILKLTYDTIELALPIVRKKEKEYYESLSAVIEYPWKGYEVEPQLTTKINEKYLPWTRHNGTGKMKRSSFDEKLSDNCMASIIGTSTYKPCSLDLCWKQMTMSGSSLYHTTHQILWLQLAIQHDCEDRLKEKAKPNGGIDKLFRQLCANVIFSMETIADNSLKTSAALQDIFLEQGCLCGAIGFMDAVNQPWLAEVLKWQSPKLGCFMNGNTEVDADDLYNDLDIWMYNKKQVWRERRLLYDVSMGGDCSSHKSAVGAGFLAVYLRLFLDPAYVEYKLWPNIYGPDYVPPWKARRKWMLKMFCLFLLIILLFVYFVKKRSLLQLRIFRPYFWAAVAKQILLKTMRRT